MEAFEQGTDDVLTIPFAPEELLARVSAVVRRSYNTLVPIRPKLKIGDLEIDITNRLVRYGGHEVRLTALELALLYLLAANADEPLSRDEILTYLWGNDYMADSNVIDRHIRNLRIKLQNTWRRPKYIVTVPGRGYQFRRPSEKN